MSLLGKRRRGRRIGLVIAGSLFAFQALAIVGAQVASAAVTCTFANGTVTVTMDAPADTAVFTVGGGNSIRVNGTACQAANLNNTTAINVTGSAGTQTVSVDLGEDWGNINWTIDLADTTGTDVLVLDGSAVTTDLTVYAGASGVDLNGDGNVDATVTNVEELDLMGGAGNDTLSGGGSSATGGPTSIPMVVTGGDGDDTVSGGSGDDVLDGGLGSNTLDYSAFNGVTVDLGAGTATGAGTDTVANFTTVIGSPGDDTLTGSGAAETFMPGAGDDTVSGGGGADTVDYSDQAGPVTYDTAAGTVSGAGTDTLTSIATIVGTTAQDLVDASAEADGVTIDLRPGGRFVDFENAKGSEFDDEILGNAGRNRLWGLGGADTINGFGGNDTILPGAGNDDVDGDAGTDLVSYRDASARVQINLATQTVSSTEGDDTLANIEGAVGSPFSDSIVGDGGSNLLRGAKGNDNVRAGGGDDTVKGGPGKDRLRGGSGDDDLFGGAGNDYLDGGGGSDFCKGGPGRDRKVRCESGGRR